MGLFGFGKKVKVAGEIVQNEPKRNGSLVYANPGSRVYHYEWGGLWLTCFCRKSMTERQALGGGMHRCKKCEWINSIERTTGQRRKLLETS